MARFYLVPKVGTGSLTDPFRPKYFIENGIAIAGAMDLGIEPTFLVGANPTDAQHAILAAASDVFVIPDIATTVGGNPTLNRVRNSLEQRNIPGSWVLATTTYREIVGSVGRNCQILQRLRGLHQTRLFPPGVSLDSTPTADVFSKLVSTGQSFGLNTSTLAITLTVRENLLRLTTQMPAFTLAGETF